MKYNNNLLVMQVINIHPHHTRLYKLMEMMLFGRSFRRVFKPHFYHQIIGNIIMLETRNEITANYRPDPNDVFTDSSFPIINNFNYVIDWVRR